MRPTIPGTMAGRRFAAATTGVPRRSLSTFTHTRRALPTFQHHVHAHAAASPASFSQHRSFSSSSPTPSSTAAPSSRPSSTSFAESVLSFLGVLRAQVPKGWERFFPRGTSNGRRSTGPGVGAGEKDSKDDVPKDSSSGGSSGSGGGRRTPKHEPEDGGWGSSPSAAQWLFVAAATGALFLATSFQLDGQELTYQEFKTKYLEQGLVDKLEVDPATKKVRVILKRSPETENGAARLQEPVFHFYIGSVESFERALQETQRDMGLDPHDYVSVRYINSANHVNWTSILLQVAFYAGLFYLGKQLIGGMGGGRGGKGNPFSFGKSTAQLIKPGDSKVSGRR
jgi:hypothetical protein